MRGFNRVFLMGYLGNRPELLVSKGGKNFTKMSVAVNRRQKLNSGEFENTVDWHKVVVWGKSAQLCCNHLLKGSPVAVEGSLTQARPLDPSKGESAVSIITADQVHFLPSPRRDMSLDSSVAAEPKL